MDRVQRIEAVQRQLDDGMNEEEGGGEGRGGRAGSQLIKRSRHSTGSGE